MKPSTCSIEGVDSVLPGLIDEITERLNRGDAVDVESYVKQHPELAIPLRQVWRTLSLLREPPAGASLECEPAPDPSLSGRLGDFRIGRELGRGGMGVVYEAEQISLGRKVALKVLPFAALLDQRQLNRFRNEARAAAALHHPHIVPVYGVGEDRGVHFYAMQLIEGQNLAELLSECGDFSPHSVSNESECANQRDRGRPLPRSAEVSCFRETERLSGIPRRSNEIHGESPYPKDSAIVALSTVRTKRPGEFFRSVARLGASVADALHYAHEMGVVHRDVKPSNLLVDRDGHVWVTDFGLAVTDREARPLTMSGDLVGTLRYMSPEQAEGKRAWIDRRTDVYSLGVTLYELATRHPAFGDQNNGKLLRRILEEDPRPPRHVEPAVPRDLETVILKAIEKHPSARYDTAAEFAEDLRNFVARRPIHARRTTRARRLWQWVHRNSMLAAVGAVAACLLVILAVAGPVVAIREARLNRNLRAQEYVASIGLVASEIELGKIQRAYGILERYRESDLRGYEWHLLQAWCEQRRLGIELTPQPPGWKNGGTVRDVAFSPDGTLLATAQWSNHIKLWDVRRKQVVHVLPMSGKPLCVVFSADGEFLVAGSGHGQFHVWNIRSRTLRQTEDVVSRFPALAENHYTVRGATFSPDAQWLVAAIGYWDSTRSDADREGAVCVFRRDTADDNEDFVFAYGLSLPSSACAVTIRPDGSQIVIGCGNGDVLGFRMMDGGQEFRLRSHDLPLRSVAFSPDGKLLASASCDQTVKLWSGHDRSHIRTLSGHGGEVHDVAFSPNGRYLASASFDRSVKLWETGSGAEVNTLWGHSGPVWCVAFSPTSGLFASGAVESAARVWLLDAAVRRTKDVVALDVGTWGVTFSPDGHRIATCAESGQIWIGETVTGEMIAILNDGGCVGAFAFSRDGRMLVRGGGKWHLGRDRSADGVNVREYGDLAVWDVATLTQLTRREAHDTAIRSLLFTPAGDRLFSVSLDGSVKAWDFPGLNRSEDVRTSGSPVYSASLSPDGGLIALGTEDGVELWREERGSWRRWRSLTGHADWVAGVAFSPDGRMLASASIDGTAVIWDADGFEPLHTLLGDGNWRMSVAFSRDSRTIAIAHQDHTIKLYHVETGSELLTLKGHTNWALAVAFSPVEDLLVSTSADATLRFWRAK